MYKKWPPEVMYGGGRKEKWMEFSFWIDYFSISLVASLSNHMA